MVNIVKPEGRVAASDTSRNKSFKILQSRHRRADVYVVIGLGLVGNLVSMDLLPSQTVLQDSTYFADYGACKICVA